MILASSTIQNEFNGPCCNLFFEFKYFFQGITDQNAEKDRIVSTLVEMGFLAEEASSAIDRCGMLSPLLDDGLQDSFKSCTT